MDMKGIIGATALASTIVGGGVYVGIMRSQITELRAEIGFVHSLVRDVMLEDLRVCRLDKAAIESELRACSG